MRYCWNGNLIPFKEKISLNSKRKKYWDRENNFPSQVHSTASTKLEIEKGELDLVLLNQSIMTEKVLMKEEIKLFKNSLYIVLLFFIYI